MPVPRVSVPRLALALLLCCCAPSLRAEARPQSGAQDAVKLYAAAKEHLKKGDYSKALKEAEAVLAVEPEHAPAHLVRGQALKGVFANKISSASPASPETPKKFQLLRQAVESFQRYLRLTPGAADAEHWRQEILFLSPYAELAGDGAGTDRTVFLPPEVTVKARILYRPEPVYPEEARQAKVNGRVVVLAILGADGTVSSVFTVEPLSQGVSENAAEAVRKMKFAPATKDGRPVSQLIKIEYNFDLY